VPVPDANGLPLTRDWTAPFAVDVRLVLGVHRRGPADPAFRADVAGAVWRTSLTPEGPGTLRVSGAALPVHPGEGPNRTTLITAAAWGPGALWLLDNLPVMLGGWDEPDSFAPTHPVLRDLVLRYGGLRIGQSGRVFEALVPAVLEQKVVGREAQRAWRRLLTKFGRPAPGPAPEGMRVFPHPNVWAAIPLWEWHRAGVERGRAATIVTAARVAGRLEQIIGMSPVAADRGLRSLPGIGLWTSAEVRQRACGDADAVSVGDYHLPALVGQALAGQPTDDRGMLRLLAPYRGHRYRVSRLVELSGIHRPRHAPRAPVRDYRAF
jgi:3-methyladenine DNA glycosylase/8-oxoguanine DNA glycosylase